MSTQVLLSKQPHPQQNFKDLLLKDLKIRFHHITKATKILPARKNLNIKKANLLKNLQITVLKLRIIVRHREGTNQLATSNNQSHIRVIQISLTLNCLEQLKVIKSHLKKLKSNQTIDRITNVLVISRGNPKAKIIVPIVSRKILLLRIIAIITCIIHLRRRTKTLIINPELKSITGGLRMKLLVDRRLTTNLTK